MMIVSGDTNASAALVTIMDQESNVHYGLQSVTPLSAADLAMSAVAESHHHELASADAPRLVP